MLQVPRTIRFATSNDITNPSKLDLIAKPEQQSNIEEGYALFLNEKKEEEGSFDFFAVVNIDNGRLLTLFEKLAYELPELASLVFGTYLKEPFYGQYANRDEMLACIKQYSLEVQEDCNIYLSMVFSAEDELIQAQISETKNIKFWGVNVESFEQIMQEFALPKKENLALIENYPLVIKQLVDIDVKAHATEQVIDKFKEQYLNGK